MKSLRPLFATLLAALPLHAQTPPLLNDTALKVELYAAFPDIETPTTVAAAPDGAVYVGNDPRDSRLSTKEPVCTITRFTGPGGQGKTTFADKLYSPAGSLWHDGWLYVIHDPLLSRFKDTNGDGVADVREDLVTGLGPEPHEGLNDHVVSGFTLGMDGFFYISVGDKGVYHAKGKDGSEITLQGGGIVRCRPDGTGLEVYSGGTRNHLEVDLDALDHAFTLDNTDDGNGWWTRLCYHIESGYYGYPYFYKNDQTNGLLAPGPQKPQFWPGAPAVNERFLPCLTDFGGGSPCGGLCYLSDGLPAKYRGKLFFSEWGQRKLSVIEVAPEGAAFKFVSNEPLLAEDKGGSFRPMQMYTAADGSLLVADWGYGGWKAPKKLGALWRLSWPDASPAPRLADEAKASGAELIAALGHVDRNQRLRAEWALARRSPAEVLAPLIELLHDEKAPTVQRAHALWTLDLLGEKSAELRDQAAGLIRQLLEAKDPALPAQAIRALGVRGRREASGEIAALAASPVAEVRLQAAIALGRLRTEEAIDLGERLSDPDRWVRFASRMALAKTELLAPTAQVRLQSEEPEPEQSWLALESTYQMDAVHLLSILAIDSPRALEALGRMAYLPREWDGHWWSTQPVKSPPPLPSFEWEGTKIAVGTLTWALTDFKAPTRLAAAQALAQSLGTAALPVLRQRLTAEQDPAVRRQLIETLGVQKDPEALTVFAKIALDEKADPDFRNTAAAAVANIGGDAAKAALTRLVAEELSPAAMLTVVEAISHEHVVEAAPALARHASAADPVLRLTALKALSALGAKANATAVYLAALADKDGKVVGAALDALGSLHEPATLGALLAYGQKHKNQKEVINALAQFNDPQVIPILVEALGNNNSGARKAALATLKKMRTESWPKIEERIAAGKIPEEIVPEIHTVFDSGIIAKWKVLGPFENVWGAVHPPETEALATGGNPDLRRRYTTAEAPQIGWRDANADAEDGKVDLGSLFKNNGMVCAYAYVEINATAAGDATFLCGSDDQIAIWLNGQKVHDNSAERGFVADSDQALLHLQKGTNALLVKIGNASGDWIFAGRIPGLDGNQITPSAEPPPDVKQRAFALAAKPDGSWINPGDARHGEQIFSDPAGPLGGVCATCHAVKGKGGQVGPDLGAVAVNYKRPDLITSIQEPSKTIALGFEQFAVETKNGEYILGAIRQETAEATTVVGADGQPHTVKKADEKERSPVPVSLMPPALTLGLKPQDFADLLGYLETLKGQ